MKFDFFKKILFSIRHKDLLGFSSHKKIIPKGRDILSKDEIKKLDSKLSAVCLLVFKRKDKVKFLLTERNVYEGAHSGQISFVGGKKDDTDLDLKQTAIRETKEEVGVTDFEIICPLSKVYIPPSNFIVYPFVAISNNENLIFKKDDREVKKILEVDIIDLLNNENFQDREIEINNLNKKIKVPCFILNDKIVWSATAMILQEFKDIITNKLDDNNFTCRKN